MQLLRWVVEDVVGTRQTRVAWPLIQEAVAGVCNQVQRLDAAPLLRRVEKMMRALAWLLAQEGPPPWRPA